MILHGKNVDLRPIAIVDTQFVLSLRLNSELSQYLNPVENDLKKQQAWIQNCLSDPMQWYFIIQNKKQEPIGTIRIYNVRDNTFCWGSWIVIPEARSYASLESIVLLYQYAFFELNFDVTFFDVRKKNQKALEFYSRFGAKITHEDDKDYFLTYSKYDFKKNLSHYTATINIQKGPHS